MCMKSGTIALIILPVDFKVAIKVTFVTKTKSFGFTSESNKDKCKAEVPLDVAIAYLEPT